MGSQPPEGGDKPQGENNNNNNNTNSNSNSSNNYKDILNNAGPDITTPGKKKSSFEGDFIIISEFSEQVGPVPIDIIPESSSSGTFDLNAFVLKIMAVDFQNKSNDPQNYLKDSQVAMPEPKEDAYTYLHHFNLLDVFARGYVRPMCLSYVTHDRNKIMDYFHEIMTKVSKITRVMKRGNHRLFLRDLEDRMEDVRYTQSVMSSGQDLDTISPTPVTVNEYLADLEVMHQKFHRAVALKQQRRAARAEARGGGSKGSPHALHAHRSTPQPGDEDEDDFDDEEWMGDAKHEGEGGRRREGVPIEKSLNKAVAELSREYQPQVIQSLHPKTLHGKSLRNLQALCDGSFNKAMSLIYSLHRDYSRPLTVLALDAFDTPSLAPASSLLTIGQSVMLNFNLEMDKYMNKVISYEAERVYSAGNLPSSVYNNNSTQTITSNNSSSIDDDSSSYGSARSMGSAASSPARDELYIDEALENGLSATAPNDSTHHLLRVPTGHEENPSSPSSPGDGASKPKLQPNINFFSANLWPPVGQTEFPGKGLLDLRGKFVWLRHLLYSILRGRPVIIWGSAANESVVRGMVQALSILVAGNNAGITPWRTKSLKMSDLASFKLTGLIRTCPIAKAVEKYVTIFDLENETLKSPPYPTQAKFVDEILALKRQWPDELSYLAHVHYVLFDIGVKACMYYHRCCVTVHQLTPQQASQAQAYVQYSAHSSAPLHNSHSHTHSHHSGHYHTSSHPSYTPHQTSFPRSHSPHPRVTPHPHPPPSPRPLPAHSPYKPSSQPPSPHPSQPPSPHPSQPPSPRHSNQTPSPHRSPHPSQPPSPRQPSLPPLSPSPAPQQPPHTFAPLRPSGPTSEPRMEVRPEPVRLDMSQEIEPPKVSDLELLEKSPESKNDATEVKTEPRLPEEGANRTRSDSKPELAKPRRKSTVNTLSFSTVLRSQSMSSIGEKYRPAMTSTNNSPNNTTNANSNNTINQTTTGNINHSNITVHNVNNINMNSSMNFPNMTAYGNFRPGEEWRNSSLPSPNASRHSSWHYGKSYSSQSYRSLSDSQISPIWLPDTPAAREKTRAHFFQQLEIVPGDTDITMYLAEVVKEQQASEMQGSEAPVIRLDYSSCQIFSSKVKEGSHPRR